MATAWRSRLRFHEPWPLHHPHLCYYLRLVWLISLAFLLMKVAGAEGRVSSKGCLQKERDALLLFKAAIEDPSARLSAWRSQVDCCAWTGVVCHNRTGSVRVAELNLQNPNDEIGNNMDTALRGELLHPSLLSLTHLVSLNLSFNDFEGTQIPPSIASLHKLRSLDLSCSNFSGTIPVHLGNLTNLRHLDLYAYPYLAATVVHSLSWLSGLSSLIYLDMSYLYLSAASHNWLSTVNALPSLQKLYLYDCSINDIPFSLNYHLNLTSLTALHLGGNNFNSSFPNWLWNLTSLSYLRLGDSGIRGALPNEIGNLINLTNLDLSSNLLSDSQLDVIWKFEHLADLYLSNNVVENSLLVGITNLSSLSILFLDNCSLVGPIPSWLGNLTTLIALSLKYNSFSGPIPIEIWKLVDLYYLDLSFTPVEGHISEFHLSNLTKLEYLYLLENPFMTIGIGHGWTPPFQLQGLSFGSFNIGPRFPTWLRSQQSIALIQLYNTGIEDTLPEWFWISFPNITYLDFSHNKISGTLPTSLESLTKLIYLNLRSNLFEGPISHFPPNLSLLDLSFNAFSGPLPSTLFTPQLLYLLLSHNHISGSIPSIICNSKTLMHLNLLNNQISGIIPRCWQDGQRLQHIHLGNNLLSGEIPSSLGNLMGLQFLHLNNNNLKGHLPSSLQNFTQILVVDLGDNKFSGNIPLWIGQSWKLLRILRLSSNMFDGYIDPQLGHLRDMQIIDLANNKLLGSIPHSFGYLKTMISTSTKQLPTFGTGLFSYNDDYWESITLVTKGDQQNFSSILYLVKSIDLSNNELTNEIPEELGYLVELHTLNLSRNYFKGKIPDMIGKMSSLETLDLSFNNLSGVIPQGLSQLQALNHLNLSYNNLSGNIPSGYQLQTLDDVTIYIGNPYLCGDLVKKTCFHENNINVTSKESSQSLSIYLSIVLGFLVGLWSVFIFQLIKKNKGMFSREYR